MGTQDIVVYAIGGLAAIYMGVLIIRFFGRIKRGESPCDTCSGCELVNSCKDRKAKVSSKCENCPK